MQPISRAEHLNSSLSFALINRQIVCQAHQGLLVRGPVHSSFARQAERLKLSEPDVSRCGAHQQCSQNGLFLMREAQCMSAIKCTGLGIHGVTILRGCWRDLRQLPWQKTKEKPAKSGQIMTIPPIGLPLKQPRVPSSNHPWRFGATPGRCHGASLGRRGAE